jgi:ATP-binding cassette subfamily B protein
VSRYARLWLELMRLSFRHEQRMAGGALVAIAGSVAAVAVSAVSARAAVDAAIAHRTGPAVTAAVIAALTYALSLMLRTTVDNLINLTVDRVGRLQLHGGLYLDVSTVEGIDHLERSDYLDRLALLRRTFNGVMSWSWSILTAVERMAELAVMVLLLGTVTPLLGALLVFAVAPVLCDRRGQRVVHEAEVATEESNRLQQELFELSVQASSGKDIRVSGAADEIASRQRAAWDEVAAGRYRAQLRASAARLLGWLVFGAGFVGALGLVTYRTAHGTGSVGDLVLTILVASRLRQAMQAAVTSTMRTTAGARMVHNFLWLRDYVAAERARATGTLAAPPVLRSGLRLDGVSFVYPGTDRAALTDLSVAIPAGTVVAVVGEYGSGKTTLVKLLTRCYRPSAGSIQVDGIDLLDLDASAWRARSSAAFQDFGRFHTTVAESVGLGDVTAPPSRVEAAVRESDAHSLVSRLPKGLSTQLGVHLGGVDLSEGQWQRIALARAAMRTDPVLFVLDEPTASLDAPSEEAIYAHHMTRARDIAARTGAITVIVSHRFSTVAGADLILVLHEGRLVESGGHAELLRAGGRYADLYGLQATAYARSAGSVE